MHAHDHTEDAQVHGILLKHPVLDLQAALLGVEGVEAEVDVAAGGDDAAPRPADLPKVVHVHVEVPLVGDLVEARDTGIIQNKQNVTG